MFVDKAKIYIKGGDGGDGLVAFRREKYVPNGGPAGGDGGKGGDIIFRVEEGLRTLLDFKYQKHFKADRGEKGKVKSGHGANAGNKVVLVPQGTVVINDDTQKVIADMTRHNQEVIVARGGRGGRGNIHFATPNNPAPEISENGEEGEERWIVLELKVMADVGLVGFPSVGKSTLLSVVSAAKPKIGDYPFTTLTPNLGMVDVGDGRSFVMADLPGLIEGAHEGVGLGHEFLRHIERTRVIVHVVDMSAAEGRDPYEDWLKINKELALYSKKLEDTLQIIVANKMDVAESEFNLTVFKQKMADNQFDYKVYPLSAITKEGIQELLYKAADLLDQLPESPLVEDVPAELERKVYRLEQQDDQQFSIQRENDLFIIDSPGIEKFIKRTNFSTEEGAIRFARIMRKMGIDNELRKQGAEDGHIVRIGDFEFEFVERD